MSFSFSTKERASGGQHPAPLLCKQRGWDESPQLCRHTYKKKDRKPSPRGEHEEEKESSYIYAGQKETITTIMRYGP